MDKTRAILSGKSYRKVLTLCGDEIEREIASREAHDWSNIDEFCKAVRKMLKGA